MKIIVFIKETLSRNAELSPDEIWPGDQDDDDVMTNDYDKHALEAGLQIMEAKGEGNVTAVCFGAETAEKVLKRAVAMGVNDVVRIDNEDEEIMDPFVVSKILVAAAKKMEYDLILFGMQSYDFGTATMAPMVAERLALPSACWVEKIEFDNGHIAVDKVIEGGTRRIKVKMPAVLSIASTGTYEEPRYTSVRRIMKASKTQVPVWELDDLEVDIESTSNVTMMEVNEPEARAEECAVFKDDEPSALVEQMLAALREKGLNLGAYKE
ncbi:MAG: electron transfer flavoprotein subunit beta/FixA family protein [Candidatus Heimdallarchaeota archaeon]